MKLLFIQDVGFSQEGDTYYSASLPSAIWNDNYLPYFDSIRVLGKYSDNKTLGAVLSSTDKVDFALIYKYTSIITFFLNYFGIKNKIKEEIFKTDVTVVRLSSILGYVAIPILIKYNRPFFVEAVTNAYESYWHHGSITGKLSANYLEYLNKKCIKRSPYVIYVARKLKNDYPTDGYNAVISDVSLPHIVTLKDMQASRFTGQIFRIGLIGTFAAKYKGQDVLLKAVSLLEDDIKRNIELYFFGVGDFDWVINMAKQFNLYEKIKFIGKLSHDEIFDNIHDLSLYVQPSLTEGMPRALLEAMSRGCPVLASSTGGIPEIIGRDFLHKPGDYKKLSTQIRLFYENRELLKKEAFHSLELVEPFRKDNLRKKRNDFFTYMIDALTNKK
jgi:glycosyltransferase involved in cell wall biosynthesis